MVVAGTNCSRVSRVNETVGRLFVDPVDADDCLQGGDVISPEIGCWLFITLVHIVNGRISITTWYESTKSTDEISLTTRRHFTWPEFDRDPTKWSGEVSCCEVHIIDDGYNRGVPVGFFCWPSPEPDTLYLRPRRRLVVDPPAVRKEASKGYAPTNQQFKAMINSLGDEPQWQPPRPSAQIIAFPMERTRRRNETPS